VQTGSVGEGLADPYLSLSNLGFHITGR